MWERALLSLLMIVMSSCCLGEDASMSILPRDRGFVWKAGAITDYGGYVGPSKTSKLHHAPLPEGQDWQNDTLWWFGNGREHMVEVWFGGDVCFIDEIVLQADNNDDSVVEYLAGGNWSSVSFGTCLSFQNRPGFCQSYGRGVRTKIRTQLDLHGVTKLRMFCEYGDALCAVSRIFAYGSCDGVDSSSVDDHVVVSVAVAVVIAVVIVAVTVVLACWRRKQNAPHRVDEVHSVPHVDEHPLSERFHRDTSLYDKGSLLGRGTQGAVFSAVLHHDTVVAVKEIPLRDGDNTVEAINKEMDVVTKLSHPFVVRYEGVIHDKENHRVCLVMEQVTGNSLRSMVRSFVEPLPDGTAKRFVAQIALGLAYLHEQGVIHRDLKPDNVLLSTHGTVKLADFGCAKEIVADTTLSAQTLIGSPAYMAPEVAQGQKYTAKADVWSLGITCAEIVSAGVSPWPRFDSLFHLMRHISEPSSVPTALHASPEAQSFIAFCCNRSVDTRPTSAEVLSHEWIANDVQALRAEYDLEPATVPPSTRQQRCSFEVPVDHSVALSPTNEHALTVQLSDASTSSSSPRFPHFRDRSLLNIPSPQRIKMLENAQPAYRLGRVLGRGAFGTVFLALLEDTGEQVAAKEIIFSASDPNLEKKLSSLQKEVKVLKGIVHEHLVGYYFSDRPALAPHQTEPRLLLFMEYVPGGTLAENILSYGRLPEKMSATVTAQVLLGLQHLHSFGVFHRDIKPANVMLTTGGQVKLADFGSVKEFTAQSYTTLSMQGTPAYMAPEVIRGERGCGPPVDVWSLGCMVMEMLTAAPPWAHFVGHTPLKTMNAIAAAESELPLPPDGLSPSALDFLRCCLVKAPSRRATVEALLTHEWIASRNVLCVDESTAAVPPRMIVDARAMHGVVHSPSRHQL